MLQPSRFRRYAGGSTVNELPAICTIHGYGREKRTPYTRPWSIYFSRIRTLPNSLTHSLKSYPILSLPHLFLLEVIPYTEDDDDDDQEDQDDDDGN